jgi:hypothetical protein
VDETVQKGPCSDNHRLATIKDPCLIFDTDNFFVFHNETVYKTLPEVKALLFFHNGFHGQSIELFVALKTGGLNSRSLGGVEQTEMHCRLIGDFTHLTPQGIDFFDKLTLSQTSYRRITGHQGYGIQIDIKKDCFTTHACRCQRRFTTSMPAPNNDNIIIMMHL